MQITFKLLEIASNIFSKSYQLKDLYLVSLTEGFDLNINIYESISNNLSYKINYKGTSKKIRICLMKEKLCLGVSQIKFSNQNQTIEIYLDKSKDISKKIKLTILCNIINNKLNKKSTNDKMFKSPDKTSSNTSTLTISSCMSHAIKKNITTTPINKIAKKNKNYFRNNSQNNFIQKYPDNKIYIGLRQKNIYFNDKINNDNSTLFSERSKQRLSGNVSLNSYFSENNRKINKKIFSPKVSTYSNQIYKETFRNINNKKKNKSNSMIITNEKKNNFYRMYKFSNEINIDNINKQIEKYIMDKSIQDELQNDIPLIYPQEKKKFSFNDNINESKFGQLLNDFLLLYNIDGLSNLNINEIELEFHFLVEKIYELIIEYYKEYHSLLNQNNSFINNIKFYSYEYNNLLKLQNSLNRKIEKENINNILNDNKNEKYYSNNIKKINKELEIFKNINLGLINKNINIESSKKLLKNILSIVVNKNKSSLNQKQITNLNKINIKINVNENKKYNPNKKNSLNYLNKRKINNNMHHKNQNEKKRNSLDNINRKSKNTSSKDKKFFESDKCKIKVKARSTYS